jgi:hypothetical protein
MFNTYTEDENMFNMFWLAALALAETGPVI